jgi:hypothetical protein
MKLGVGILYRQLSSEREFGDYERWRRQSVVMKCTVKPSHILEVKNLYADLQSAPLAVLLPGQAAGADVLTSSLPSSLPAARSGFSFLVGNEFLGTYSKFKKFTIGFVMSACLSFRMEHFGSHWKDFHLNLIFWDSA